MLKREHRLVRYLDSDFREHPRFSWQQRLDHFLEATPETDLVEIDDPSGLRLYPERDPAPGLTRTHALCSRPCLDTDVFHGHHLRVLTHSTSIGGAPVRLILIGSIDEHYDILHTIDVGFLGVLPLLILGSVLGGFSLSRRALAPVGQMTYQARSLSLSHLSARIPEPPTGDELQELASAWNDMLRRLEASTQSLTQFTADASHDLRTAITVIIANAELALRRERSPERYREALASILGEGQHMLTMLEDLLLASRSGWDADVPSMETVDLVAVLREVYDAASAAAAIREHRFMLNAGTDHLWIRADRMLLRRLISVLVDNAIKYTNPAGLIWLRLQQAGPAWHLEVVDNGVGIAPELQSQVFERLFRVDKSRAEASTAGHGLGLAIARWIAEAHQFRLELMSVPGEGSVFRIEIAEAAIVRS